MAAIDPIVAIASFIIVSFFFLLIAAYMESKNDEKDEYYRAPPSWVDWLKKIPTNISKSVSRNAIKFMVLNAVLACLLCLNQLFYCLENKITLAFDISYYLQVNTVAARNLDALTIAASINSFAIYLKTLNKQRKLSSTTGTFILAFHTKSWENVLTTQHLIDICQTEKRLQSGRISCLRRRGNDWQSLLPSVMNTDTCELYSNAPDFLIPIFSDSSNEIYLQDDIDKANPKSAILVSFASARNCASKHYYSDFKALVDAESVGGIDVTFISSTYINQEFLAAVMNAILLTAIAMTVGIVVTGFSLKSAITTTVAIFGMIVALVSSVAVLKYGGYESFSAFNVLGLYILMGVGMSTCLLFASAARKAASDVAIDSTSGGSDIGHNRYEIDGYLSEKRQAILLGGYSAIAAAALFTAVATCVSLYSKVISPVIVISQLGLYAGTNFALFHILFHSLVIPAWEIAGRGSNLGFSFLLTTFSPFTRSKLLPCCFYGYSAIVTLGGRLQQIIYGPKAAPTERSVRFMTTASFISILLSLAVFVIAYFVLPSQFVTDFGIPQLFLQDSNLGQVMTIAKSYRQKTLSSSSRGGNNGKGTGGQSTGTTSTDDYAPPAYTGIPSRFPTGFPTRIPTSGVSRPTFSPLKDGTGKSSGTSYDVLGCWGIEAHKPFVDSGVKITWDSGSFIDFVNSGELYRESVALCDYLDSSTGRADLGVSMYWNRTADCLYDQLMRAQLRLQSLSQEQLTSLVSLVWPDAVAKQGPGGGDGHGLLSVAIAMNTRALTLMLWASQSISAGQNLGVDSVYSAVTDTNNLMPVWICSSVSAWVDVSSLDQHHSLAAHLSNKWTDAFVNSGNVGSINNSTWKDASDTGKKSNVNVLVGSTAFKFPQLAAEVLQSILLAAVICVGSFMLMIFLFTQGAVAVTIFGSVVMLGTLVISLALHILFCSRIIDLLDVVVLIAIIGMVVDFPIHFILHFDRIYTQRLRQLKKADASTNSSDGFAAEVDRIIDENTDGKLIEFASEERRRDERGSCVNVRVAGATENIESEIDAPALDTSLVFYREGDEQPTTAISANINSKPRSHALLVLALVNETRDHLCGALLGPLLIIVGTAAPLLFASFTLLVKTGQYTIILALVSYAYSMTILPCLLYACYVWFRVVRTVFRK